MIVGVIRPYRVEDSIQGGRRPMQALRIDTMSLPLRGKLQMFFKHLFFGGVKEILIRNKCECGKYTPVA